MEDGGWKEPHEVEREVHQLLGVKSVSWGGGRGWKEPHEVEREVHQLLCAYQGRKSRNSDRKGFSSIYDA